MKTVLCFGDSNTWGYKSETGERFSPHRRWSGILSKMLGGRYSVIEEGLCGRTTAFDDPDDAFRSGEDYLVPCLESHSPIDLVIIMLGTNDLKDKLSLEAQDIAGGMERLLRIIEKNGVGSGRTSKILLISPANIAPVTAYDEFLNSHHKSKQLSAHYAALAERHGCGFLDASSFIAESDLPDGVHLSEEAHLRLGSRVSGIVKEILR
jgi:lysophospholipase L1-like esterase